jgi:hypothetical protein
MAGEVDALMLWDLTELRNAVLDVVETAAWLHAQDVYLYARHRKPDGAAYRLWSDKRARGES